MTPRGPGQANGIADGFDVAYDSPSRGRVTFGWQAPLLVDGVEQPLAGFARHDSPFAQTPFEASVVDIAAAGYGVRLDFARGERVLHGPR